MAAGDPWFYYLPGRLESAGGCAWHHFTFRPENNALPSLSLRLSSWAASLRLRRTLRQGPVPVELTALEGRPVLTVAVAPAHLQADPERGEGRPHARRALGLDGVPVYELDAFLLEGVFPALPRPAVAVEAGVPALQGALAL